MATTNGDTTTITTTPLDEMSSRAPPGTVLPPRNMREIVEKTAGYVARNGITFEDRIRSQQASNSKFSFLTPDDAYHAFYRWRIAEIKEGRGTDISAGRPAGQGAGEVSFQGRQKKEPEKPEEFAFSARMPNISAQDLDVVRLTALFVAKNGRSWMTALSQREAGNFQFDFLRPQHSLYQFFSRLVDQYTELLTGDTVDGGRAQKKRVVELEANVADRFRVLERARKRAEWVRYQEVQKVAAEEQEEKEKVAYAQIDWHDFVVVETVAFDERDENAELPAPTSLNDLQSASLEQKAAMRVGADRRIEEAMPTFDDYEQFYGQPVQQPQQPQQAQQAPTPAVQTPLHYTPTPPAQTQSFQPPPAADEENTRITTLQADCARARAAQEAAKSSTPSVKIRRDYIPAAQQAQQQKHSRATTSICPDCHQPIPNSEMEQHLRIEMLDPAWRDQHRIAQQRSATTNLSTADVANNLKRLASQRTDVFDPVTGQQVLSEEEMERRRVAERRAYDGVSVVPNAVALAGMGGLGQQQQQQGLDGNRSTDVQEQIRLIHERARNG